MKKLLLMAVLLITVVGCQAQKEATPVQKTGTTSSAQLIPIGTYSNPQYGFEFDHPADWTVENGSKPESAYGIVAWIYTPQAGANLDACKKAHQPSEWQMQCGPAQADSAIGVYDYEFINYETLDETSKLNYPNYQKLNLGSLNAFEYTGRTQPPSEGFHINNPDGKSGITFTVFSPTEEKLSVAKKILSTFKFTAKK